MNVKAVAINSFAKFILGGATFSKIKGAVGVFSNRNLSGPEKRAECLEYLKGALGDLAGFLVNLGIELAVAELKTLAENNGKS